jgi:hypothetical protein
MSPSHHVIRNTLAFFFLGWLAYTCFRRAFIPPKTNLSWWHLESYAVNKNVLTRTINVLAGILILLIAFSLMFGT